MPKYELMYILASTISDDQVPNATEQIKKIITDFEGENLEETQLGKKKLAYPIKKTRNGHYVVVSFDMPTTKINQLDAKIRAQTSVIIRYLLTNQDEYLERLAKDIEVQSKMPKRIIPEEEIAAETKPAEEVKAEEKPKVEAKPELVEINAEELDKKIEEALSEDITK